MEKNDTPFTRIRPQNGLQPPGNHFPIFFVLHINRIHGDESHPLVIDVIHPIAIDLIRSVVRHGIIIFNGAPPLARFDLVVPVPASGHARGYNPPELLARPLAQALNAPLQPHALRKCRATHTQKGLSAAQRLQNLSGAFQVRDARLVEGRRILLVDDVITTGATVSCCAAALMKAGALEVFAVAAANTER